MRYSIFKFLPRSFCTLLLIVLSLVFLAATARAQDRAASDGKPLTPAEVEKKIAALEQRIFLVEKKLETVDEKLDAILAAVKNQPPKTATAPTFPAGPWGPPSFPPSSSGQSSWNFAAPTYTYTSSAGSCGSMSTSSTRRGLFGGGGIFRRGFGGCN